MLITEITAVYCEHKKKKYGDIHFEENLHRVLIFMEGVENNIKLNTNINT